MPNCYPIILSDLETIAAMPLKHQYAVNKEDMLVAYGDNDYGQLGVGDFEARTEPTVVALPDGEIIIQILVGNNKYTLVLCESGNVYAWGSNSVGQLGVGDFKNREKPTAVALPAEEKVFRLRAGLGFVFALCKSGKVYAWGYNNNGQLGIDYASDENAPSPVCVTALNANDLTSIVFGDGYVLALQNGDVWAWGRNYFGQLGFDSKGESINKPNKIDAFLDQCVIRIAAGKSHAAALTKRGDLYTWGQNNSGELGLGDRQDRSIPTKVILPILVEEEGSTISHISLGKCSTAVLRNGKVYTWGDNMYGTLGRLTSDSWSTCPALIDIAPVEYLSLCNEYGVAVCYDGRIFVWGHNDKYQLGVSDNQDRFKPTELKEKADSPINEIFFNDKNIGIARDCRGEVYIWGDMYGEVIQTPRKLSTIFQNRSASPLGDEKILMSYFPLAYLQQIFVLPDTRKLIHLIEKGILEEVKALLDSGCKFDDISLQEIVKAFYSSERCSVSALFKLLTNEMLPTSLNTATLHLALVIEQMTREKGNPGDFDLTRPENQLKVLCQNEAIISSQLEYYDQPLMEYAIRECCDRALVRQLINLGFKARPFSFIPSLGGVYTTNKGSYALPYFDNPRSRSYIAEAHPKKRYLDALKSERYKETQDAILGEYVLIALDLLKFPNEEIKKILEDGNDPGYKPELIKMVYFVISFSAYTGKTDIFSSINLFKLMEKLNIPFSKALVKDSRSHSNINEGVSPIYLATLFNNEEFIRQAKARGLVQIEDVYYSLVIAAGYDNAYMVQFLLEEFGSQNENWSEQGPGNESSLNPLVFAIQRMNDKAWDLLMSHNIGVKFFKERPGATVSPVTTVLYMLRGNLPAEANERLLNVLQVLINKGAITKNAEGYLKQITDELIKKRATEIIESANSVFPKKITEEPTYANSKALIFNSTKENFTSSDKLTHHQFTHIF